MKIDRWIERVYEERDVGRGIGTSLAGVIGLSTYLVWNDWVTAIFATMISFPVIRIAAAAVHSRRVQSKERKDTRGKMREAFDNLGAEEVAVARAFVWHGGTSVTWREANRSDGFSAAGIESLSNRGLVHTSVTLDGLTETFVLDVDLFDYAKTVVPEAPF
ncbi:MAG: hypothetical protein F4Z19_03695 [Holophagales bacterium]|nr:hypothetical protein [Holophagales bacterium]MYJ26649.1 hypothetical protein [Holophagales bacterium]